MTTAGIDALSPSRELRLTLPVATMRSVYNTQAVQSRLEQLLAKGDPREHEALRSTWARMIEKGWNRFAVKPSGVPDMQRLYDALPNFQGPLDDIKRHVALSQDSQDGLEVTPILLLGPPWIGKTHFAKQIADLLGTGNTIIPMSSMTAGWILSGSNGQWKWAKPGKVFATLVDGQYANPVIVVDEIDKASADAQYDPLGALYSLLEHDTAQNFVDEFAEVPIDASQVIWITTANDERSIPEPIRNRMNVFEIEAPTPDQARVIGKNLYRQILGKHDWGNKFDPESSDDILDILSDTVPREMRRALMTAFWNARLDNRYAIVPDDFPKSKENKNKIGFIQ